MVLMSHTEWEERQDTPTLTPLPHFPIKGKGQRQQLSRLNNINTGQYMDRHRWRGKHRLKRDPYV